MLAYGAGGKCWTPAPRRLPSQARALDGAIPSCADVWLSCSLTVTATATGMIQHDTPWYQVNIRIAAALTTVYSVVRRDTL